MRYHDDENDHVALSVFDVGELAGGPGVLLAGGRDAVGAAGALLYRRVRLVALCKWAGCDRDALVVNGAVLSECAEHSEKPRNTLADDDVPF